MREIKFKSDHILKIKEGDKTTTLRTVKKDHLYPEDSVVEIHGSGVKIYIKSRTVVKLTKSGIRHYDTNQKANTNVLVEKEGFNSWEELIEWFENRRYKIPQPMFLYEFEIANNVNSTLEAYEE